MIMPDMLYAAGRFGDLPEQVRHRFEDTWREGREQVIINEESMVVRDSSRSEPEVHAGVSLASVLTLLSKMKDTLEKSKIESSDYDRIAP